MCIGTFGFEIANTRTADNKDWNFRTFGTGKGFTADEIVAGVLRAIVLESLDGSCRIDLGNGAIDVSKGIIRGLNSSWDLDTGVLKTSKTYPSGNTYETSLEGGKIISSSDLSIEAKKSLAILSKLGGFYSMNNDGSITIGGNGVIINSNLNTADAIKLQANTSVLGNFAVTGTKNCIQSTENNGERLFYSVEDTDSYLTFRVSNIVTTGQNKEIKIGIDEIYKECVNLEIDYIVEINKVSFGDYRIKEQTKDYFVLESDRTNFEFKYTIVAKRKGYEDRHLDEYRREVV